MILFKIEIPIDDRIEEQSRKENPMKEYKEIDNTVICEWKLVHLGFCVESTHALMINNWAYLFKKIFIDTLFLKDEDPSAEEKAQELLDEFLYQENYR